VIIIVCKKEKKGREGKGFTGGEGGLALKKKQGTINNTITKKAHAYIRT
jgi:hypothetical protein